MTTGEIFFIMLSIAMAFAASLFAYDCKRKEEEIENQSKEISFLSRMLEQIVTTEAEQLAAAQKQKNYGAFIYKEDARSFAREHKLDPDEMWGSVMSCDMCAYDPANMLCFTKENMHIKNPHLFIALTKEL